MSLPSPPSFYPLQKSKVCSEATFQPLLQLYLLLPGLICFDYSHLLDSKVVDFVFDVPDIQVVSVISSCLALAWSFNTYQATRMNGALDFSKNPAGRIILLLSCICQISSRLFIMITFAYICGPDQFWPMILFIVLHMLLMAVIHYFTKDDARANENLWAPRGQVFYQCLINGISNLYLHNNIIPLEISQDKKKTKQNQLKQDRKQMLVDTIIMAENLTIIIVALFKTPLPTTLLVTLLAIHFAGLLLKVIFFSFNEVFIKIIRSQVLYYQHFHIWSSLIPCCPLIPKEIKKFPKRKSSDVDSEPKNVYPDLESAA